MIQENLSELITDLAGLLPGELRVLAGVQVELHHSVVAVRHYACAAVRADRQRGDVGGVTVARQSADWWRVHLILIINSHNGPVHRLGPHTPHSL